MRKLRSITLIAGFTLWLALLGTPSSTGQISLPTLRGTVKDPSGAAMQSVDIAVIQGTKVLKAVKTSELGTFSFEIPAGQYQLAVAAPDFKAYAQTVRVSANMPSLTITMTLEGITTTVDVVGNTNEIIVDAATSLDATVLTAADIQELPDDEEDLLAYLQNLAGGAGNAQIIIDGFEGGRLPRRDQIAQIVIEPNSFNAAGTGPRITVVSREPGPRGPWTGNASLQYRDSALNARNPHAINKPSTHRTMFSTSYRGPVIKGRLGMDISLSKEQYENGSNSIRAITPGGAIDKAFFSPSSYESIGIGNNWYFSQTHNLTYNFSYNRGKDLNQGIGNFTLEERASDSSNSGWNFQMFSNKTISPKLTNTAQFRVNRNRSRSTPRTNAIAINVIDAFNGGGAQNRSESRNSSFGITETLRWTPTPKLNFQFALNMNHQSNYNNAENNYLGTFTFSSLADYLDGRPLTFTQSSGNPVAEFKHSDANIAVNMTYRITPTMSYSAGAQYSVQTHLRDYNNISPTTQLAMQFKQRHTLSVGVRMTYPTVGFPLFQYEQLIRGDGTTRQFNTVISNPTYPDPFAGGSTGTTTGVGSSLQTRDPNFEAPYTLNTQVSFTEAFPKNWRLTTTFAVNRGVHQLRNRNVNAPYPGTPLDPLLSKDEIDRMRPFYPYVGRINRFESVGNSLGKNLTFQVQVPTKTIFKTVLSGTFLTGLTWQEDDAQWQNPYDIRADWARNDQRFRWQGTFSIRPPKIGSFSLNYNANTGRAYTITTGKDENLDQAINDRPVGVKRNSERGPGQYTVNMTWSSPAINFRKSAAPPAVAAPPTGAAPVGLSPQDQLIQSAMQAGIPLATIQQILLSQPNLVSVAGAAPTTPLAPPSLLRPRVTLRVNVTNLLNNTRVNAYSGVITSPLFGRPTGYGAGRSVTLSLNTQF